MITEKLTRSQMEKNLGEDIVRISRELFGERLGDYVLCRHTLATFLHDRFTWESIGFFIRGIQLQSFKAKLQELKVNTYVDDFIPIRDIHELNYQRKLSVVRGTTHYFILRKAMNEKYGEVPEWI